LPATPLLQEGRFGRSSRNVEREAMDVGFAQDDA